MNRVHVVHLFPGERAALLTLLTQLTASEWASATICAGWSVKDIAAHLLADDLGILSRLRDGFADASLIPPGADLSKWDDLLAFINRQNAVWVQATRRLSPAVLIDLLVRSGEQTAAYFASLDPNATGGPVNWAGPRPAPLGLHIAREYTERWTHQQHIRDAVNQPGLKEPTWFAPVLATFVLALPHALRAATPPVGTQVRLTIDGASGGAWIVVRRNDGWEFATATATGSTSAMGHVAAEVSLDEDDAWRLFTRGLTSVEARRRARVAGDRALIDAVLAMVSVLA